MLHVTCLSPHALTPTYLLTCSHTLQHTVIDPIHPMAVRDALGSQPLDLILLTSESPLITEAAEALHHRMSAPILASNTLNTRKLPIARYLTDGEVVGLGPLAQTVYVPQGDSSSDIMCYALGSEGLLFTGPLFAGGTAGHKANKLAIAKLRILPTDTTVHGGNTHGGQPLGPLLDNLK